MADLAFLAVIDRPVAFHPAFARLAGSAAAGILLSQACYWATKTGDPEGWFFKTRDQWTEETALSRREQETARRRLRDLGVLHEKRGGMPQRLWFRVDMERLQALLNGANGVAPPCRHETYQQEGANAPTGRAQTRQHDGAKRADNTSSTETTTEITAETTSDAREEADEPPDLISAAEAELRDAWNALDGVCPIRGRISGERAESLKARLADTDWRDTWREAIDRVAESPFCCGENDRGWKATLDWFLRPDTVQKLIEGHYDFGKERQRNGHQPKTFQRQAFENTMRNLAKVAAEDDEPGDEAGNYDRLGLLGGPEGG